MHRPLSPIFHPRTDISVLACPNTDIGSAPSSAVTDVRTVTGANHFSDACHCSSAITQSTSFHSSTAIASDSDIRQEIDRVLKTKAIRLSRIKPFVSSDQDDLHQELRIAWLANAHRHDPARGTVWPFLKTVVERTAGKLRDKALSLRRYAMNTVSLERLSHPPGADAEPKMAGEDHKQLRAELHEAIQELPGPLAHLCLLLGDQSVAEISRSMAIPRSTVVARVAAIRRRFESKKLSTFL